LTGGRLFQIFVEIMEKGQRCRPRLWAALRARQPARKFRLARAGGPEGHGPAGGWMAPRALGLHPNTLPPFIRPGRMGRPFVTVRGGDGRRDDLRGKQGFDHHEISLPSACLTRKNCCAAFHCPPARGRIYAKPGARSVQVPAFEKKKEPCDLKAGLLFTSFPRSYPPSSAFYSGLVFRGGRKKNRRSG